MRSNRLVTRSLFIALSLLTSVVFAQKSQYCDENAVSQAALNKCAEAKYKEATIVLEELVTELKEHFPEGPEKQLVKGQKAWEELIGSDCKIISWYLEGGSARSMMISKCYEKHTQRRIRYLSSLLCHPMKMECEASEKYKYFHKNPAVDREQVVIQSPESVLSSD